jgi:ribosomal protein S18
MKRELKENPEFFKAFPHLQKPMYEKENPDLAGFEYSENIRSKDLFSKDELTPEASKRDGYYQSLLHQHTKYMAPDASEKEDLLRENELNYVSGYLAPDGPFKYMSEDAKQKVHMEIDERMQELEETGLTRNEILFEEQEGIKL